MKLALKILIIIHVMVACSHCHGSRVAKITEVFNMHLSVFPLRPPFSTTYLFYHYHRIRNCLSQDRSVDKSDVIV